MNLKLWCTLISFRTWVSAFGKIHNNLLRSGIHPPLDDPMPRLAAVVTKIIFFGKTEPASSWSTLRSCAALASLSELSTISAEEAQEASEIFLATYLSLCNANEAAGSLDYCAIQYLH